MVDRLLRAIPAPLYERLKRSRAARRVAAPLLNLLIPSRGPAEVRIAAGPLQGMVLTLDPRRNKDMVVGRYEPKVIEAVMDALGHGDTAVDVGAHVGYAALAMARAVGSAGSVVAVEADPHIAAILEANIARNAGGVGAPVTTVNAALAARSGTVSFRRGTSSGVGHVVESGGDAEVTAMRLDDLLDRHGPPDLVKVDVEGAELEVLRGAQKLLAARSATFIVEAHSDDLHHGCRSLFESGGYRCDVIGRGSGETVHLLAVPS